MVIKFDIVKIWAVGCYKRYMWIGEKGSNKTLCVRINKALYAYLKFKGVPTLQSMRKKL